MATHDYNIANQTGANFRADLNNALSAILSNNASATEPTTTTAYMLWVDTGNNLLKMRNSDDNAWITLPVSITTSNTVDIDGGTVNTITSFSFSSGATVTTILDEDDLSSDSASALATQQSIKAYVDSQVTAQDLDFQGDTGGALSIDLDSETFTISGGNGIATSGALNTLTIAIDSSVVTLTDTQTLTNKSIDADSNTISNLEVDNLKSGVLDTDLTSVSASDDTLASSKAIKTYVDAQITAQDLDITDGTTSISIDLDSEELSVLGGTGVTSTASGNGVTLAIGQDVGTTADVTFNTVAADLTGDVTGTVSSIANHSTSDLSEGTNLYYTTARFDSAFSGKSTSDLTEGTNLYFTDARARAAISASGDLSYNSTTGVISFTERTDAEVRGLISASGDLSYNSTTGVMSFTERTDAEVRGLVSASGDLSYNSTTGVFSFTERTDAEVRGLLSGGTGVTYNNTTGVISIGQAVGTSDNVTFGDVIVSGDLTVSGTTTTINTETINLADNIILFNSNATGTPSENAGIEIERGDATNKTLIWNETDDKWTVGSETFVAGTFEGNVTGTVSSIANHDTDDLSEGASNLYYTTARFDSAFSGKSTSDLTEGTNLYYTTARFDSAFSGKSTSDLTEGTNLYYTTARANSDFDTRLATKSTSDLAEGTNLYYTDARFDTRLATKTTDNLTEGSTNLYYTDARVDSHLSGGTGVTYSGGVISIGQAVGTTDDVTFNTVTATDEFLGDIDGAIQTTIRNTTGSTIYKGQAVYVTGLSGDTPTVGLAKANSASTMPAVGIARADINNNATGQMTVLGTLEGIDTSASNNLETGVTLSINDVFYVSATEAGNITNVAPTGESNLIQNLGRVVRVSPNTNMTFSVQGAGRTNATPNLNSGKIFYGNGSNQSVATTLDTSIVPENTNLYYTDARANSAIDARVTKSFVDALGVAASTATTLATARDFSLTGDVTAAAVSFDGSGNVALSTNIGSNTVGITELNVTDGTSGQVLTTNGAGTLSFADAAAGYSDSDVETYLNTSAIYTDATNDRLGLGTSSPMVTLNVHNPTNPRIALTNSTTGQTFPSGLELLLADSDAYIAQRENANLIFSTNNTERLRIDNSGNVGIGTSSPSQLLHLGGATNKGIQITTATSNAGYLAVYQDETIFGVNRDPSDGSFADTGKTAQFISLQSANGDGWIKFATTTTNNTEPSERVRITGAGNLGVGTSSPVSMLHLSAGVTGVSGGEAAAITLTNKFDSPDNSWTIKPQRTGVSNTGLEIRDVTDSRSDMSFDGSGNIGIGSSSPSHKLSVAGVIEAEGATELGSSNTGACFLHYSTNNYSYFNGAYGANGVFFSEATGSTRVGMQSGQVMTFETNAAERMRINSSGDVGIGTSSITSKLHVDAGAYAGYAVDFVQGGSGGGNHGLRIVSGSASSYTAIFRANAATVFYVDGSGNYYFSGSNQSDVNKKENIADITDSALDLITQLQPKTYNFIGSDIDKAGFIAQEMEQVIPRLVTGNTYDPDLTDEDGNNPTGKGIDYMGYTAYLTKAIQEQQVLIEQLQAEVALLKGE